MKLFSLLLASFLTLSLAGCAGSPLPPTDHQVQKTPETMIVQK